MSEVDDKGQVLTQFTDVDLWPLHLSTTSEGDVLVTDYGNDRILLLNSQLQLERVLLDRNSQVKPWWPRSLHYNELTSSKGKQTVIYRTCHMHGLLVLTLLSRLL